MYHSSAKNAWHWFLATMVHAQEAFWLVHIFYSGGTFTGGYFKTDVDLIAIQQNISNFSIYERRDWTPGQSSWTNVDLTLENSLASRKQLMVYLAVLKPHTPVNEYQARVWHFYQILRWREGGVPLSHQPSLCWPIRYIIRPVWVFRPEVYIHNFKKECTVTQCCLIELLRSNSRVCNATLYLHHTERYAG